MTDNIWSNHERMGNRKVDACDAYFVFGNGNGMEILPYSYGDNIDQTQVVFSSRYLNLVDIGLLTGDISGMNDAEKLSFKKFIDYEDGFDDFMVFTMPAYFTGDDLVVSENLDQCIVQAVYGNETVQCSDDGSSTTCCPF